MPVLETHLADIGEGKSISEASQQSAKGHMPYDFDDEHVRMLNIRS